jgi:CheY-like chemotaxis protein
VGVGSEFTADIPLTIDESVLMQPKLEHNFDKMLALIVDDDLVVCEQTSNILRDIGMSGEWVTTGTEAVDRVRANYSRSQYYDYILIDWKMPDMDGIETTREIRRVVGPDVTIIIITAYDWESIEVEAKAAGANMLISKPLLKSTLVSAFQRAKNQNEYELPEEANFDFTGRRVLVVEDNQINAEIAKNLLESRHCTVELAPNGLKAMELYIQNPAGYYDAVLMDIRMPLMDGLQATINIRHWSKEDAKTIPIIAMTANAFDEDVEKSRAAGMNAHLSKPIEPNNLYAVLERLIDKQE